MIRVSAQTIIRKYYIDLFAPPETGDRDGEGVVIFTDINGFRSYTFMFDGCRSGTRFSTIRYTAATPALHILYVYYKRAYSAIRVSTKQTNGDDDADDRSSTRQYYYR